MTAYRTIGEVRAKFYPGMTRLVKLDTTELIGFRHSRKLCPYCREGRSCPHVQARHWREAADRIRRDGLRCPS